ncbi:hypothetical protein [Streptomyces sp. NPDC048191]|uniref:hypothetical protein n=1 Tax=Streptomyces sp. NPDC048191 TaxID=3155484 RepID=UPI0033DB6A7D
MDGYARDKFGIWSTQPDGCTTRQDVLARDGKNVHDKTDRCQPESGSRYSVYDDTVVTVVAQATIDHMVLSPRPGVRAPTPGQWISARRSATI